MTTHSEWPEWPEEQWEYEMGLRGGGNRVATRWAYVDEEGYWRRLPKGVKFPDTKEKECCGSEWEYEWVWEGEWSPDYLTHPGATYKILGWDWDDSDWVYEEEDPLYLTNEQVDYYGNMLDKWCVLLLREGQLPCMGFGPLLEYYRDHREKSDELLR